MKEYIRTEKENFNLDNAIASVSGLSASVENVCNHHTMGTIEVYGKPFDWFMRADCFCFFVALYRR